MAVVSQLVSDVLTEGQFDATEPQALKWLTRRQRLMCSRSKCYRKTLELGPTVAEQVDYAVPAEVVEMRDVLINGIPYGNGRHQDLAQGALGYLWLDGIFVAAGGGITTRDDDASGVTKLAIYPTPTEGGLPILVTAVCLPPDLLTSSDATLVIPADFHEALVEGAIATGMLRVEGRADLAAPFQSRFDEACVELTRQVGKRFRGVGPAQIRIVGVNA